MRKGDYYTLQINTVPATYVVGVVQEINPEGYVRGLEVTTDGNGDFISIHNDCLHKITKVIQLVGTATTIGLDQVGAI